jgi:hypothetical protein
VKEETNNHLLYQQHLLWFRSFDFIGELHVRGPLGQNLSRESHAGLAGGGRKAVLLAQQRGGHRASGRAHHLQQTHWKENVCCAEGCLPGARGHKEALVLLLAGPEGVSGVPDGAAGGGETSEGGIALVERHEQARGGGLDGQPHRLRAQQSERQRRTLRTKQTKTSKTELSILLFFALKVQSAMKKTNNYPERGSRGGSRKRKAFWRGDAHADEREHKRVGGQTNTLRNVVFVHVMMKQRLTVQPITVASHRSTSTTSALQREQHFL